nr:MAG TPA: hypothetical protein [Caudoviricetes sp.]
MVSLIAAFRLLDSPEALPPFDPYSLASSLLRLLNGIKFS